MSVRISGVRFRAELFWLALPDDEGDAPEPMFGSGLHHRKILQSGFVMYRSGTVEDHKHVTGHVVTLRASSVSS